MHGMVVPVLRMPYAREPNRFVGFLPVHADHVAVRNHPAFLQPLPDIVRLHKAKEILPVPGQDVLIAVGGHRLQIIKALPCVEAGQIGTGLITDPLVFIQLHIIHAAVIGGQGGDHLLLLLPLRLLRKQLFL